MTITDNERRALQGILDSDFMDGMKGAEAVDHRVWSWSANPFKSKRTFSGVVSSLVKKGYVSTSDYGDDACIAITAAGMAALQGSDVPHLSALLPTVG